MLGAAGVYRLGVFYTGIPGPAVADTIVVVEPGSGTRSIAQDFYSKGLIDHPYAFMAAVQMRGARGRLKAGEYMIPAHASLTQIVDLIASGKVYQHLLTIPEGLTSTEVVTLLNTAPSMTGTIEQVPPEGTLLPDTYAYVLNDSRASKLARMQGAMTNLLDKLWEARPADFPLKTKEEALVLASIVEKETGVKSERARVAGVFFNRIALAMPLQSDPTVIYAITQGKSRLDRQLYLKDLAVDSPYNTYKNVTLPPTPICNPGRAAIEAVFKPEKHDYLFFVADGTGGHAFGKTLDQHNANVARWRALNRKQTP